MISIIFVFQKSFSLLKPFRKIQKNQKVFQNKISRILQTIQPCTFQNVQSPPRIPGTLLHSKFQFSFSSPRKLCFLMLSNFNPSNVVTTTENVPTQTRSLRAFNITFPHFSQPSPPRTLRIENAKGPARFSSSNHSTRFHFFSRTSALPSSRHGLLCWPTGPPPAFEDARATKSLGKTRPPNVPHGHQGVLNEGVASSPTFQRTAYHVLLTSGPSPHAFVTFHSLKSSQLH